MNHFPRPFVVDKQTEEYFPRHENPDKDVVELIFWISFFPYFSAFFCPAFFPGPDGEQLSGVFAFFFGGMAVFNGLPVWLANPAYWIALFVLRRRPLVAIALGVLACVFSLSLLILLRGDLLEPQIGYFMWCSSFVLFTLGALIAVDSKARRLHGSKSKELCLDPDDTSEPTECLSCGETIGAGNAECAKCGWSYRADT